MVDFINDQNGLAKVKDNKIVIRRDWSRERDKIQGAFNIARDLAQKLSDERKAKGKPEGKPAA